MSSSNFLVIDGQRISLAEAVNYLQVAGKFQSLLLEILSQHAIQQELQVQPDLALSPAMIEQGLIDFRVEQELTDPQAFQAWLDRHGIGYEVFRQQYAWQLTCERLKFWLSQPGLETYFEQRKPFLDQVVLSWVTVDTKEWADALHHQLETGIPFEQLMIREPVTTNQPEGKVSISDDDQLPLDVRIDEPLNYVDLPEELRAKIADVQPETVIKPLVLDDNWYVFRVETFLPAQLDEELAAQLRDEIFAQWLSERVSAMSVKLEVN